MADERSTPGFKVETDLSTRPVAIIAAGELDSGSCGSLTEAFEQVLAEHSGEPVSLDLQGVSFIDSSGMRSMIEMERTADERGIRLIVIPPPDQVTELLRTAGIAERMSLSEPAAGGGLGPGFLDRIDLELAREPAAPSRARAEIRAALEGRLEDSDIATVVLLTSELVTNAVVHPDAPETAPASLRIIIYEGGVRVEVQDPGNGFDPASPGAGSPHGGRGLVLVENCSASWGAQRTEGDGGAGFCVWFEFLAGQREAASATG